MEIKGGHQRINLFMSRLNEPQKRWHVATLFEETNGTSDRQVAIITGLGEKTIQRGKAELRDQLSESAVGGGRLRAEKKTHS